MKCTYALTVSARCPVKPRVEDEYDFVIETDDYVPVEALLLFFEPFAHTAVYQEELTQKCLENFKEARAVCSTGEHSGVKTICEVKRE